MCDTKWLMDKHGKTSVMYSFNSIKQDLQDHFNLATTWKNVFDRIPVESRLTTTSPQLYSGQNEGSVSYFHI